MKLVSRVQKTSIVSLLEPVELNASNEQQRMVNYDNADHERIEKVCQTLWNLPSVGRKPELVQI